MKSESERAVVCNWSKADLPKWRMSSEDGYTRGNRIFDFRDQPIAEPAAEHFASGRSADQKPPATTH